MVQDLGVTVTEPVNLHMDATAGLGIAQRRGVGRIRHSHTPSLWLQRSVRDKRVVLFKVPGPENPADLGTKHVDWGIISRIWKLLGFVLLSGESRMALRAQLRQ